MIVSIINLILIIFFQHMENCGPNKNPKTSMKGNMMIITCKEMTPEEDMAYDQEYQQYMEDYQQYNADYYNSNNNNNGK